MSTSGHFQHGELFDVLGRRALGDAVQVRSYQPNLELTAHSHDEIHLTMLMSGSLEEWSAGRRFESGPLDVVVKPAKVPHTNRFGPEQTLTLQVSLPSNASSWLRRSGIPLDRVTWQSNEVATRLFLQAVAAKATSSTSVQLKFPSDHAPGKQPPDWALDSWRRLQSLYPERVTVRGLAKSAGVHPVHLARTFRECFGTSVSGRLRQVRVAAAAGLLCRQSTPLTTVAADCGFADQSHLCRVFKSYTSLTPLEFRQLAAR